jgi:hypothetical protein
MMADRLDRRARFVGELADRDQVIRSRLNYRAPFESCEDRQSDSSAGHR